MSRARRSLREPPDDLRSFPSRTITRALWRIHPAGNDPRWFCSDLDCRFDLTEPRGTLYLAERDIGAFVEVFRDFGVANLAPVAARRLSALRAPRALRLADCTSPRARGFGVTAEIHATDDYERTQSWAAAFDAAGFHGIRYLVRHDPSERLVGIAVSGRGGQARGWRVRSTEAIPSALLSQAARRFGIRVAPAP